MDAPKESETYGRFRVIYYGSEFDGIVYYTNEDHARTTIDDALYKEFMGIITSQYGVKSSEEGNATILNEFKTLMILMQVMSMETMKW